MIILLKVLIEKQMLKERKERPHYHLYLQFQVRCFHLLCNHVLCPRAPLPPHIQMFARPEL